MSLDGWKSFFEIGAVILLFLTFVFGAGVVITTNWINERQAERLREFDKSLTDAKTDVLKQEERAANAERDAAEAKRTAAEAGAGTEKIRQENLKLSLAVEGERKARLELERALAPRQLLPSERARLVSDLRSAPMPHVVEIVGVNFPEPQRFANILDNVFREAGWTIAEHTAGIFGDPPVGLIISTDT